MEIEQTDSGEAPDQEHNPEVVRFSDGDLGTIQDILFGAQAERLERRLVALEQGIESALASERAETQAAIGATELRLRDSVDGSVTRLTAEVASESDARIGAIDDLAQEYRDRMKLLDENIGELRGQLSYAMLQRNELADLLELAARNLRAPIEPPTDDS